MFLVRYSQARGKKTWRDDQYRLGRILAFTSNRGRRMGSWQVDTVTEDDVEAFMQQLRVQGRAASTQNKFFQNFW